MNNITQSLGFAVKNTDNTTKFLPIAEYYQRTLDNAILGITTGAFDYTTVLNRTVAGLTNSGLRTVDYASGWSNRVEVATRRAVMTGFNQIVAKVNDDNAEKLGTEYFEISWHGGARPTHQVWQGRVYTKEQLETVCGLGEVTGLCGANCYHSYYPFFPGISERTYTDEQLEEMNRQENIPVEYNGKQYTKYEALQRQRKLETTMRSQRQKIKLLQDGGASEGDVITARARYRVTSAEYTRFSKAMNLPQQRERVTIDGLGNIGAGKYKTYKIDYMSNSYRPTFVESKPISFLRGTEVEKIQVKKVNNSKFDMVTDVDNTRRNKAIRLAERSLTAIHKELPKDFEMPKIAVVDFDRHKISSNAIGGYDRNTGILYLNSKYNTSEKIINYVNQTKGIFANNTEYAPFMHELGHKYYYDKINSLAKSQNIGYNKAKDIIDNKLREYIHSNNITSDPFFIRKNLSVYAQKGYSDNKITEVIAESFSVRKNNEFARNLINILDGVVL